MTKSQPRKNLEKELPGRENDKCKGLKKGLNLDCSQEQEFDMVEWREIRRRERGVGEMRDAKELEASIKILNFIRVKSYFECNGRPLPGYSRK